MIDIPEIPYLSRHALYCHLDLVSMMEPDTEELMRERNERQFVDDEHDSPHKNPWFLSFHQSSFPGDPTEACSRQLVYRMMNIPSADGAMAPWITSCGVMGKAGELDLADAWFQGGRLLAIPEDSSKPDIHQVGFVDREHWLTGSVDLPILKPGWRKIHSVEAKAKADDVLVEMIEGRPMMRDGVNVIEPRGPDDAHVRQLKAGLGLAHEHDWGWVTVCPTCWFIVWAEMYERLGLPGGVHPRSDSMGRCPRCRDYGTATRETHFQLEQPTTGEIYYWSRSWPRGNPRLGLRTKSFFYEYDAEYMEDGREILKDARKHFEEGTLPPRHRSFQWSVGPCGQCRHKVFCRLDEGLEPRKRKSTMDKVTMLAESNGVEYAKSVRENYSYDDVRERVLSEWREET